MIKNLYLVLYVYSLVLTMQKYYYLFNYNCIFVYFFSHFVHFGSDTTISDLIFSFSGEKSS